MAAQLGCAILDANCLGEAFGREESEAGVEFRKWVSTRGRLVSGGKLHEELRRSTEFRQWAEFAVRSPHLRVIPTADLDAELRELEERSDIRSDDAHILSLARVSGARLLYTRDQRLRADFENPAIIADPAGQLYNVGEKDEMTDGHRDRLEAARPCP